ncbi:MAG: complex I subunit 5 family protein, partial [Thermodesulfobacteriota bacterium]
MGLFLVAIIPILFSILIYIFGDRYKLLRNTLVMIPSIFNFISVVCIANIVLKGGSYSITLTDTPPFVISFNADPFSVYMGLLITFLWMLTNVYSFGYMEHEHAQTRYFAVLTLCSSATLGIIFSANLITFFIFFEFLTVAVYPLVIHEESDEAWDAGVKYGVYLLTGGVSVLLGIIAVYGLTGGHMTFTPGGIPELANQSSSMLLVLFLLFMFGFGFKAAIIPMHSWLPDAMIAPTPVSAVLHAVAVVNVGLYGFYRIIYSIFGLSLFNALNLNTLLAVPAA